MQSETEPIDTTLVTQSLQKVAKGAGIVFIGTIIGMILGFLQRVLIARYYTQEEYGIFSLAFVLFNIFAVLATLGLQEGTARQIAYYRGRGDNEKVKGIIISSIEIALIASIIFSLFLFISSNIISTKIFHEKGLIATLKILSTALPFSVLINVFTAIARGFNDVKPRVYFQNIARNVLFILFLAIVIFFSLSFLNVIYALSISVVISCLLLAIYTVKNFSFLTKTKEKTKKAVSLKKDLLFFSLPLLVVAMLNMIMTWTDTLMLGYFKGSAIVGLYNAAFPLAQLIPMALLSAGFLYVPIVSELYSKNSIKEVKRTYQILTKWIFSFTLSIFFILFLFPETVLRLIFGINYVGAGSALRILCLGFMFHTFLGLNGLTLLVMGKTKFLMFASLVAALVNVVLNFSLIPTFGIRGAAMASLSAYCLVNVLNSTKLYMLSKIHPFTWNYIKPVTISVLLLGIVYILISHVKIRFWMLPFFLLNFLLSYFILLLLTKSYDKEDIEIFSIVAKWMGINSKIVRGILRKFV